MKIEQIFKEALIIYDTLYLPGLGTFKKEKIATSFDNNNKTISPTKINIIFDTNYNSNDTNLNEILFSKGFKPTEIADIIAQIIEKIKSLKDNEKFEIEDIGYFSVSNNKITFTQTATFSLDLNNFGFDTIKVPAQKISKEEAKIPTDEKQQPTEKKHTEIPKQQIDKPTKKKKFNLYYIIVPLLVIAIGIFIYLSLPYISQLLPSKKTKNKPVVQKIDTIKTQENSNINLVQDEDLKKIINSKISNYANVYLGANYKKFYIICNSFENKNNAENYALLLRQKGYNTEIINGNKYYRISIASFDNVDQLINEYSRYKKTYSRDIWILINKQ